MTTPPFSTTNKASAEESFQHIQGLLEGWTSPSLEWKQPSSMSLADMEDDEEQEREQQEFDEIMTDSNFGSPSYYSHGYNEPPTMATPAPKLSRATTPIMSNLKQTPATVTKPNPVNQTYNDDAIATVPRPLLPQDQVFVAEQCHSATVRYLEKLGRARDLGGKMMEHQHISREYCAVLKTIAYQQDPTGAEGNAWALLETLVDLSPQDVLPALPTQAADASQWVASRVDMTPAQLIHEWWNTQMPRRQRLLQWIQGVLARNVSKDATRPRTLARLGKSNSILVPTDQDDVILKHSLELILAGKMNQAQQLCRDSCAAWRAAMWSGGDLQDEIPEDNQAYNSSSSSSGNPHRPAWKHAMYQYAKELLTKPGANQDEVAIIAILSDNLDVALCNKSLRSFEHSMYVILRFLCGRREDMILHWYNEERRRQSRKYYPGTEYEREERAQLTETSNFAHLDEECGMRMIQEQSYGQGPANDAIRKATCAFVAGKARVGAFIREMEASHVTHSEELRFLAHLAIFLDSMPEVVKDVHGFLKWKENAIAFYVHHLSMHGSEMWPYIVLYTSFLQYDQRTEILAELFVAVTDDDRREQLVSQMRKFMGKGEDMSVLSLLIDDVFEKVDASPDTDTITELDDEKMRVLSWLSFHDDHTLAAILATNRLFRLFLLRDKQRSAFLLMDKFRPDKCGQLIDSRVSLDDISWVAGTDGMQGVQSVEESWDQAIAEHRDICMALQASRAYENWQDVIQSTSAKTRSGDENSLHTDRLNEKELQIANEAHAGGFARAKSFSMRQVIEAALHAQGGLESLLKYEGGWMNYGLDMDSMEHDERLDELHQLRQKLLPSFVAQYCDVCVETADWMEISLQDYAEFCDSSVSEGITKFASGMLVEVDPKVWLEKALQLTEIIASDSYALRPSMHKDDLRLICRRLADVDMRLS